MKEDDDLSLLTPEERAGMEEDHGDEFAEEEDDDLDDGKADDKADTKADDKADDAPGRDDGKADKSDEPEQVADEPQARNEPLPLLQVNEDAEAQQKLADIDSREDEITQKFEDGDLTTGEYRKQVRELEKQRGAIDRQALEADFAKRHNEAQVNARWEADVGNFLEAHPEIDLSKPLLASAFDQALRKVTAETLNAGGTIGKADIVKAHKMWAEELGIQPKKAEQAPAKQAAASDKPDKKQRPPAPPSLANIPAATIVDTDSGKWNRLDSLLETDPIKFEAELGKLSTSDRNAYLEAQ